MTTSTTLISASAVPSPPWIVQGFHIDTTPGKILVPNDTITVYWGTNNSLGYDSCSVTIRPLANLKDDDAYVASVNPHPQCAAGSTSIIIPTTPTNSTYPFDNSTFIVRINTPYGLFSDSAVFRPVFPQEPWSRAEILARNANDISQRNAADAHRSLIVGGVGLAVALIVGMCTCWVMWNTAGR
ncbi:hypothetical protein LTR16_005059 [Cryomyces antarcticus]|uniref:Phytocyanin domain-containing protein n=1 Tax=Cryomyces antarcticus TaxID=329879 RepID=A0ABR0KRN2_9PEZI|nr:hypothetical protein LTR16_005059 [Cryomyces antarcticus]